MMCSSVPCFCCLALLLYCCPYLVPPLPPPLDPFTPSCCWQSLSPQSTPSNPPGGDHRCVLAPARRLPGRPVLSRLHVVAWHCCFASVPHSTLQPNPPPLHPHSAPSNPPYPPLPHTGGDHRCLLAPARRLPGCPVPLPRRTAVQGTLVPRQCTEACAIHSEVPTGTGPGPDSE
jgi:hypothetical protein